MCVSSLGDEAHFASLHFLLPPAVFILQSPLPRCVGEGPLMSSSEGLREGYEGGGGRGCGVRPNPV